MAKAKANRVVTCIALSTAAAAITIVVVVQAAALLRRLTNETHLKLSIWRFFLQYSNNIIVLYRWRYVSTPLIILIFSFLVKLYYMLMSRQARKVMYLVEYACCVPPASYRMTLATFIRQAKLFMGDREEEADFVRKMVERSGLGDDTHLPPPLHRTPAPNNISFNDCVLEAKTTIFTTMDALFEKTGLNPSKDVDILIVNSCIFCPTPSLAALVVNRYRMRTDIRSFNLGGMGCSAGMISIGIARDLLQAHPNSNAVVVSLEVISSCMYGGSDKSMLLPCCLFRVGGAAIFLSNKTDEGKRAKYSLVHLLRTHRGADDRAYGCIELREDSEGEVGVSLSKELTGIAGDAVKANIASLAPLVLPASEQLRFALVFVGRKLINPTWKPYIPDFKKAFDHICIHAGGRAVINEMQKALKLADEHVEASRMALHRYGNTSSSCLWYVLSYIEAKRRMKKGDRVWQIGLGSGFKCNSAVWKCLRTINTPVDGPWADCIDRYPVHDPDN
ncbi:separase/separin [Dionaea muscipula]